MIDHVVVAVGVVALFVILPVVVWVWRSGAYSFIPDREGKMIVITLVALVVTVIAAFGKAPLWIAVLILELALLLQFVPWLR